MGLTNCVTNLSQAEMKTVEKDLFSLMDEGLTKLNDVLSKGVDVNTIQQQAKAEGKKNLITKSVVVKDAEKVALPQDYYDVTSVKAQKQNHNFYFNYRNFKIAGTADEPFVEVGKAKDGQLFKKIKVTYRVEDKNPPKNMHVELTKLQKLKDDPKAFNNLKRDIDSDFGAVYEKINDVTGKIATDFNIAIEEFNNAITNPQTDSEKLAANVLNQALSGDFAGAIGTAIGASGALEGIGIGGALGGAIGTTGQSPLGIATNFFQTGQLPAGLGAPPNTKTVTRTARAKDNDTVEIPDDDATIVKVSVVKPGTNFFGGTISKNQYIFDTDENILTISTGIIYPKIKVTYTIEKDIEPITPAGATLPDEPLDVCKDVPNIEVKKVKETVVNAKTKIKETKTVSFKKDKAKQAVQPSVKAEPQTSIKEEETVIVNTEQPVVNVKPEAVVVEPETQEVKPITRSLSELEKEISDVNKKIINIFVESLTGPFGSISLEIPDQYPDFDAKRFLSSKSMRQFFKDEFRSKEQFSIMRQKLKEYRNEEEGIDRGISIFSSARIQNFGEDAGLTSDDFDFLDRFNKALLEKERIDNEKHYFYQIVDGYIKRLADSTPNLVGGIPVYGDIKMPEHPVINPHYELGTATNWLGKSGQTEPGRSLGGEGKPPEDEFGWSRSSPEGASDNFLRNYFEYKKTHAYIWDANLAPSGTYTTMDSVRAANFFGIMLPEAQLICQQSAQAYREYKIVTEDERMNVLPGSSKWDDIVGI